MPKRIYVGNLPFSATNDEVRTVLSKFGPVESVEVISSGKTRRALVTMSDEGARKALEAGGRNLTIKGQRVTLRPA